MDEVKREQHLSDMIPLEDRPCLTDYVHVHDRMDPTGENHWVKSVCSRPWCLPCDKIRVWRLQRKIEKYLDWDPQKHLWIITRSVRNEPELVASFNTLRTAQVAFAKQVKAVGHPFRLAKIWVATTEITHSLTEGYNVHEHMIWGTQSSRIDFGEMHKWWDRAAGFEGAHINIVKVHNSRHASNYIAKYLSKGVWGGLSSGRAYLVRAALKGRNRINTKRGTLVPKLPSRFCLCCFTSSEGQCNGEGEMVISTD